MLKKFLSLVCVAALSCAFVGCDEGAMKPADTAETPAATTDAAAEVATEGAAATAEATDAAAEPAPAE